MEQNDMIKQEEEELLVLKFFSSLHLNENDELVARAREDAAEATPSSSTIKMEQHSVEATEGESLGEDEEDLQAVLDIGQLAVEEAKAEMETTRLEERLAQSKLDLLTRRAQRNPVRESETQTDIVGRDEQATAEHLGALQEEVAAQREALKIAHDETNKERARAQTAEAKLVATEQRNTYLTTVSQEINQIRSANLILEADLSECREEKNRLELCLQDTKAELDHVQNLLQQQRMQQVSSSANPPSAPVPSIDTISMHTLQDELALAKLHVERLETQRTEDLVVISTFRKQAFAASKSLEELKLHIPTLEATVAGLQLQLEATQRQLQESKNVAAKSDQQLPSKNTMIELTQEKYQEMTRKLETLDALTDSNIIQRDRNTKLELQTNKLQLEVQSFPKIKEELAVIKEDHTKAVEILEAQKVELVAVREEAAQWFSRACQLTEIIKKYDEEHKSLQSESDSLKHQLTSDKKVLQEVQALVMERETALHHVSTELTRINNEFSRVHGELSQAKNELSQLNDDLSAANGEVTQVKDEMCSANAEITRLSNELTRVNSELSETQKKSMIKHEDMLRQLTTSEQKFKEICEKELQTRHIADAYKTEYEKLLKAVEAEEQMNRQVNTDLEKDTNEVETSSAAADTHEKEGQLQLAQAESVAELLKKKALLKIQVFESLLSLKDSLLTEIQKSMAELHIKFDHISNHLECSSSLLMQHIPSADPHPQLDQPLPPSSLHSPPVEPNHIPSADPHPQLDQHSPPSSLHSPPVEPNEDICPTEGFENSILNQDERASVSACDHEVLLANLLDNIKLISGRLVQDEEQQRGGNPQISTAAEAIETNQWDAEEIEAICDEQIVDDAYTHMGDADASGNLLECHICLERLPECSTCSIVFSDVSLLQEHQERHHKSNQTATPENSSRPIRRKKRSVSNYKTKKNIARIQCPHCDNITRGGLKQHLLRKHKDMYMKKQRLGGSSLDQYYQKYRTAFYNNTPYLPRKMCIELCQKFLCRNCSMKGLKLLESLGYRLLPEGLLPPMKNKE